MRKKILPLLLCTSLLCANPVLASVDDVNNLLMEKYGNTDAFFVVEKDTGFKSISIVANVAKEYGTASFVGQMETLADEIKSQPWCDYSFISLGAVIGSSIITKTFIVNAGSVVTSPIKRYSPWFVKTRDDLEEDEIRFLWNVTEEILRYNDIFMYTDESQDGFDRMEIEVWSNFAVCSGSVKNEGKEYSYIIEFAYEMKNASSGTYDTKYVEINNLKMFGDYIDIYSYSKDFET